MRTAPDYIQFCPTLRCNRACDFCFNHHLSPLPDMPLQDFSTMIKNIAAFPIKTLDIIGGEPTIHPEIVHFVDKAVECGMRVNISSNGSNIDMLRELHSAEHKTIVGVSINDRESLQQLKNFVQECKPVLKTVYGPHTDLTLITEILQLHPERFSLIYRDVMDKNDSDKAVPFYRFMSTAQQEFYLASKIDTIYCSGFLPDVKQYPDLAETRCPAGTTKLGVMPDGSVYPCNLFFGADAFLLGNILHDSFESIWNHPSLRFFRTYTNNACPRKKCELHAKCHGGCPAHAYLHTGDMAAPDPRCAG